MYKSSILNFREFCKILPLFSGVFAIAMGVLVLLGWQFDITFLKSIIPNYSSMNPVTAVCFMLLGASLLIHRSAYDSWRYAIATLGVVMVLFVGLMRLGDIYWGFSTHIDQLLFVSKIGACHIAVSTAINLILVSISVLTLRFRRNPYRHFLILASMSISFTAIVGYVFGVHSLVEIAIYVSMAIHTAVTFFILGIGLLCMDPDYGFMRNLTRGDIVGEMFRRFLPQSIVVVLILGWLRLISSRLQLFDVEFGILLYTICLVNVFVFIVWYGMTILEKLNNENFLKDKQLKENENRLNLTLKGAQIGIWDWVDINEKDEWWSPEFYQLLGYANNEIVANLDTFQALLHPQDKKRTFEKLDDHFIRKMPFEIEYRLKTKQGDFRWFYGRGESLRDVAGKPQRMTGTIIDIHDRKMKEKELLNSQSRLSLATHSAKMGVWEWNIISNKLIWDGRMYELYGIKSGTMAEPYETWEKGVHPEDRVRAAEELQKGVSGEKKFDTEFRVIWPDQTIHYIKAYGMISRDQDGKPINMIGVNFDITAQKRSERELFDQKLALDQHSIVAITDVSGKITYVNDKFCQISKYSREELLGQDHRVINSGHHSKEFIRDLWRTIASGRVWKGELKNKAKGGAFYWVDTTIVPFMNTEGKPFQYVAIRADITVRKEQEISLAEKAQELARSNAELEQFAYVASHDLQEPLRMVSSFCGRLELKYKDKLDDAAKEYIHFAVDGAKRMQGLIDALLSYAKLGKKAVSFERVDLNQMVAQVLHDMSIKIKDNNATFRIGQLPVIMANEVQMHQLFQNFISNALKYRGQIDPVIEIKANKKDDLWHFEVSDNGIGIAEEHFSKIFVIFQRLHSREEFEGTGIGLALCKKIVENYEGKAWLSSIIGKGTTFYFTLKVKEG